YQTIEHGVRLFTESAVRACSQGSLKKKALQGATMGGALGHPGQTTLRARSTNRSPTLLRSDCLAGSIAHGGGLAQPFSLMGGWQPAMINSSEIGVRATTRVALLADRCVKR